MTNHNTKLEDPWSTSSLVIDRTRLVHGPTYRPTDVTCAKQYTTSSSKGGGIITKHKHWNEIMFFKGQCHNRNNNNNNDRNSGLNQYNTKAQCHLGVKIKFTSGSMVAMSSMSLCPDINQLVHRSQQYTLFKQIIISDLQGQGHSKVNVTLYMRFCKSIVLSNHV